MPLLPAVPPEPVFALPAPAVVLVPPLPSVPEPPEVALVPPVAVEPPVPPALGEVPAPPFMGLEPPLCEPEESPVSSDEKPQAARRNATAVVLAARRMCMGFWRRSSA